MTLHPSSHMYASEIIGVGGYLPTRRVSNEELSKTLETSDAWIRSRVGIEARHIAKDGEYTSHLAIKAAYDAIQQACVSTNAIDLVIVATTTPDYTNPSTAALVQHALDIPACPAFDVQAVCSGFLYALHTADMYIKSNSAACALVIGAETMSRILDWNDRSTCVLFGDGAGAVLLKRQKKTSLDTSCILGTKLFANGSHAKDLCTSSGPSQGSVGVMTMNGREVFKSAIINMTAAMDAVLKDQGLTYKDVDWLVPHQANQRILDGLAERINISPSKVISTIHAHANTSAATIPLALKAATCDGRIKKGQLLLMPAMGGGFTWGASLVRY